MRQPERVTSPLHLGEFRDIIDVRAPHEFAEDHIPGAINLPVLNDAQHHEVGLLHASSPFEARRLGATLITENIHAHLATTLAEKGADFDPLLYCWRGNMRSSSMAVIFRAIGWRARILD
ncbi:rhodanese-like domain-containing protein, partial [Akkermansiaceae bacterium]|nr:rhodanese-like domain-containing protein [Akkermansiaceae bacterium]